MERESLLEFRICRGEALANIPYAQRSWYRLAECGVFPQLYLLILNIAVATAPLS